MLAMNDYVANGKKTGRLEKYIIDMWLDCELIDYFITYVRFYNGAILREIWIQCGYLFTLVGIA